MFIERIPVITNRFEVVLLILLSFIVSTRLIWLQLDDRAPSITDEFYASSLYFKRELAPLCPEGVDPGFPYGPNPPDQSLDPQATISPGLLTNFLALCQKTRLRTETWASFAPHLTTLTAFSTAVAMRLATSNWVAGMLTASVVLSRGSIAQGTHLTGTYLILHPMVSMAMLIAILYARSRDPRFIPALTTALVFCIFISPLFALISWPLLILVCGNLLKSARNSKVGLHRSRVPLLSILIALLVIPGLVWILHVKIPMSTAGIGTFLNQFIKLTHAPGHLTHLLGSATAEMESQDFHWQASLAAIALAATWRRRLPNGSGFWAIMLLVMTFTALVVDGTITSEAARQKNEILLLHFYHMREAVFSLEPLIIGAGAGYTWIAVRKLIIMIFPRYSNRD